MLRTIHQICTYLLITLGVVHVLFTLYAYDRLTPNAVWFVGAGMALIFVGFLNVALARGVAARGDRVVRVLCYVANFLSLALGVMSVFAVREPQAYFGVALLAAITLTASRLK